MKLKLLAPLSAIALLAASCSGDDVASKKGTGTLNPGFAVDYSITSSRAAGRAAETATVAPEISQFTFRLVKDDNKFDKTYTNLGEFVAQQFPVGAYTLEATYGDPEEEGIDKAYYYGTASFNIYDGETAEPSLTATLANTAVSIEYTDAFKKYFTAYSSTVHSSNGTAYVDMPDDASKWAYVKTGDIVLNVNFTKQNGKSGEVEAAKITDAKAGTHYHIVVDANGGEVGNEQITISFDDTTDSEPVDIDVSDDVIDSPAPVVTPSGYTSGTAIDILEGDDAESPLKASVLALAGFSEVRLSISSPTPALASLQGDIDLLNATAEQQAALTAAGFVCKGLWNNPDKLAVIDFSGMMKNLRVMNGVSTHTFTIQVKDKYNKVSEPVVLTVNAPAPLLNLSNAGALTFGENVVSFDMEYNGKDLQNKVKFQATNEFGNYVDCTYNGTPTEIDTNKYHVSINIPASEEDVKVRAIYNSTTSNILTVERKAELRTTGEVWAKSATVKLSPASRISKIASLTLNGVARSESFNAATGNLTFTGLTPATEYTAVVTFNDGTPSLETKFTTETVQEVPNGDFENLTQTISETDMKQSGIWAATAGGTSTQNTCSFTVKEPTGWASVNSKTCNANAGNKNSWFVIPSTYNTTLSWLSTVPDYKLLINYGGGGTETPDVYKNLTAQHGANAMVVRNVAWDANGTTPKNDKSTYGRTDYYNHNVPSIANRSAGKLFLGSYSYSNGVETYNEGVSFTSRPAALKGYYKYTRDSQDASETGVVTVTLLNGDKVIGTGTANLTPTSNYTEFTVDVNYTDLSLKATKLKIMIASSNHASSSQSAETSAIKTSNYTSRYESASRGAELTIDNLTFDYK